MKKDMDELILKLYKRLYVSDFDSNMTILRLIDLVSSERDDSINFYPGIPSDICCETAYFVSLTSNKSFKARIHESQCISLDEMLRIMFKHIFLKCLERTSKLIFICDDISTSVFHIYAAQFRTLKKLKVQVQIVYFSPTGPQDITKLIMP